MVMSNTLRASSTCLVRIDRNRYSVPAEWANSVVSVRLTANQVRVRPMVRSLPGIPVALAVIN